MPYLIDASNLGGVLGGRRGARDPAAVLAFLLPWARHRGAPVVVIFDGPPHPRLARRYGPLEVAWSGARSADEALLARLAAGGSGWIVITEDRELARRCRDAGARVEPASALAGRLARPHPGARRGGAEGEKPAPGATELSHWRRAFGRAGRGDETAPARSAGAVDDVEVAPGEGLEPPTNRLTAGRSTTELPRKGSARRRDQES